MSDSVGFFGQTVFVVDDDLTLRNMIAQFLTGLGLAVQSFSDGTEALAAAVEWPPDVFLLDIVMPAVDGYDVCKQLKSSPRTRDIAVLFMSGRADTWDKVSAFGCGGVDYIAKPFHLDELRARVETHLKIRSLAKELQAQNRHLEELVGQRTQELKEAHARLSILDQAKSDFLNLISHELRTPLGGILGFAELLFEKVEADPSTHKLRHHFDSARNRMLRILDDALLLTQIQASRDDLRPTSISLASAISMAVTSVAAFAEGREVTLKVERGPETLVLGDPTLLSRAIASVLDASIKLSKPHGTIEIRSEPGKDPVEILVETGGRTIPDEALPRFFDVFSIAEPITAGGDLGLAAPLAHRILSLFGGSVSVANRENGTGVVFRIRVSHGGPDPAPFRGEEPRRS